VRWGGVCVCVCARACVYARAVSSLWASGTLAAFDIHGQAHLWHTRTRRCRSSRRPHRDRCPCLTQEGARPPPMPLVRSLLAAAPVLASSYLALLCTPSSHRDAPPSPTRVTAAHRVLVQELASAAPTSETVRHPLTAHLPLTDEERTACHPTAARSTPLAHLLHCPLLRLPRALRVFRRHGLSRSHFNSLKIH